MVKVTFEKTTYETNTDGSKYEKLSLETEEVPGVTFQVADGGYLQIHDKDRKLVKLYTNYFWKSAEVVPEEK